jgi:hypothetical protein
MARVHRYVVVALAASSAHGLDNGVAVTPPMGWNSYMSGIGGARRCMTHHDLALLGHLHHLPQHRTSHACYSIPSALHLQAACPHAHSRFSALVAICIVPALQCSKLCSAERTGASLHRAARGVQRAARQVSELHAACTCLTHSTHCRGHHARAPCRGWRADGDGQLLCVVWVDPQRLRVRQQ